MNYETILVFSVIQFKIEGNKREYLNSKVDVIIQTQLSGKRNGQRYKLFTCV